MNKQIYQKLADLLLFGIGFEPGDKIVLSCDFDQRDAALTLSKRAYEQGAAYVHLVYIDQALQAQAIQGSSEEFFFPEFLQSFYKETTSPGWKSLAIVSNADGDVFADLDADRAGKYFKSYHKCRKVRQKAIMENRIPWTLTYLPSAAMAKKAYPHLSEQEGIQKYWEVILPILRLDLDDPVAFWREKMNKDKQRSQYMNDLKAVALHFKGPGTDISVPLASAARWIGGYDETTEGQKFMANIPTDEIFTSPDYRKTEGRVTLTKPFVMHQNLGPIPQKAWFEFKDGKVVDYGAEEGKETLDAFFALDENAKYIGEVALVDPQSPFAKAGITYYNGLYDENAACHLALGKAYPFTLIERGEFSEDELRSKGLNCGSVHEDMMIGGEQVDVTAELPDGTMVDIIKSGKMLI